MHPNRVFHDADDAAAIDRAVAIGFAHICIATPQGPRIVHAPLTRSDAGVRFHVARGNRATPHLDGAQAVASVAGVEGYISPSWYAVPGNQVPTWNYVAIELEGRLRMLDDTALTDQLDALAAAHEPRVAPDNPWRRDKMDGHVFGRMLAAIIGFELVVDAVRATTKLSQNKSAGDRQGVIAGLHASGNDALGEAMSA